MPLRCVALLALIGLALAATALSSEAGPVVAPPPLLAKHYDPLP